MSIENEPACLMLRGALIKQKLALVLLKSKNTDFSTIYSLINQSYDYLFFSAVQDMNNGHLIKRGKGDNVYSFQDFLNEAKNKNSPFATDRESIETEKRRPIIHRCIDPGCVTRCIECNTCSSEYYIECICRLCKDNSVCTICKNIRKRSDCPGVCVRCSYPHHRSGDINLTLNGIDPSYLPKEISYIVNTTSTQRHETSFYILSKKIYALRNRDQHDFVSSVWNPNETNLARYLTSIIMKLQSFYFINMVKEIMTRGFSNEMCCQHANSKNLKSCTGEIENLLEEYEEAAEEIEIIFEKRFPNISRQNRFLNGISVLKDEILSDKFKRREDATETPKGSFLNSITNLEKALDISEEDKVRLIYSSDSGYSSEIIEYNFC